MVLSAFYAQHLGRLLFGSLFLLTLLMGYLNEKLLPGVKNSYRSYRHCSLNNDSIDLSLL